MDTRKAFNLAKAITAKTGQSACVEQKVWHHEDSPGEMRTYYELIWFRTHDECDMQSFANFREVLKFAKEKWNV
jgi:hypothetical protein